MFKQSLIQVFKGLAEFHSYVPVTPATLPEPNKLAAACQAKHPVVSTPQQRTTVSCC